MRLAELKTGEKAVIVKVLGHGGFRKRIIEMGFVRGKVVESLQNAPLLDPVKYRIMTYEVSLRRSEAENIEVVSDREVLEHSETDAYNGVLSEDQLHQIAFSKRKHINVALVGNPNSGKTSLFNQASGSHEHVGNYGGVTVDAKEGSFRFRDYTFKMVDLPGTYSLSAYTPEEVYVRRHLAEEAPDVVVNVVDASNLERNLFLTTQLIDMNLRMVIALNMYDELQASGNKLDHLQLSKLLGAPVIPTIGRKGWGLDTLFHVIIKVYEGTDFFTKEGEIELDALHELHEYYHQHDLDHEPLEEIHEDTEHRMSPEELEREHNKKREHREHLEKKYHHKRGRKSASEEESTTQHHEHRYQIGVMTRHIHVNHGPVLEKSIQKIRAEIVKNEEIRDKYSTRFLAIKLLEGDKDVEKQISLLPNASDIISERDKSVLIISGKLKEDAESAITNAKYGFISGALAETYKAGKKPVQQQTKRIDSVVLNKYLGYPAFLLFMFLMFECTFKLGQYPMDWIDAGVGWLAGVVDSMMYPGPLKDLIVDGIIGGVGGVIVFLPNILILYFFISFMEDSGYMSRAAFIMDRIMHKMGLHGKSFIPMVMGFGCSVPAIMSTRTIENRNGRMITMLVTPLMSCSARLPVYLLLAGAFFPDQAGLVLFGLYLLGILLAVLMARIFKRFFFHREEMPFVMELPPYRLPTLKSIFRHMWEKAAQYLKKMGTVILVASILIWFLGYFPQNKTYNLTHTEESRIEQQENSYIGQLGKWIEPALSPLGFDWKIGVSLLTGLAAKEVVVSTMGVLYVGHEDEVALSSRLKSDTYADGTPVFNGAVALALMVFVLLYFPCIASITAIKNESGSWKWGAFTVLYTLALAWVTAFVVYRVALLLI
ncbi:MAG: ferrous iron transport protein B [Bacteroidales bacterium]|nr:ferrous iron transport protein B [Bacteroidales bacterium]